MTGVVLKICRFGRKVTDTGEEFAGAITGLGLGRRERVGA